MQNNIFDLIYLIKATVLKSLKIWRGIYLHVYNNLLSPILITETEKYTIIVWPIKTKYDSFISLFSQDQVYII